MVNLKWGIRRRMEVLTISLSSSLSTSNLKWHIRRRMEAWLASYAAGAIAGTFYNPIIEEQFIKATIHSFDRLICHCANIDKKEEIWNDRGYMGCETFFFYKFKHLFSFKILYRRLWGQIHKISLDTIVEIHLLLFPLLRLLCKYWLILYYCIATRQDRQGPRLTLGSGLGNLTNCSKLDIWSARLAVSTMGGLGQCGDLKWAMSGI